MTRRRALQPAYTARDSLFIVCIAVPLLAYIIALKNKSETHLDTEQGHAYQPIRTEA